MVEVAPVARPGAHDRRGDQRRHADSGRREWFLVQGPGGNRDLHRQRWDVIEEPAVLVVDDDEHRLRPSGTAAQRRVDIAQKVLAGADRVGWVIVVRRKAEVDGRVAVLRLDEDHLRHLVIVVGGDVARKLPHAVEVAAQDVAELAEQREERKPAVIGPPAHSASLQPIEDQIAVGDEPRLRIVDRRGPGERHHPVRLGVGGQRREPAVTDQVVPRQEIRHEDRIGRQVTQRGRLLDDAMAGFHVGAHEPAHRRRPADHKVEGDELGARAQCRVTLKRDLRRRRIDHAIQARSGPAGNSAVAFGGISRAGDLVK